MPTDFVFFGTDQFAVRLLDQLKTAGYRPFLVITRPDRPRGRRLRLAPPPVKVWAMANNLPCQQPDRLAGFTLPPCSVALVASYGKILPSALLSEPRHGFVNVHPSLLPRYRGATPLQSAILNGESETGVTLMVVDKELDHGPIIAQAKLPLSDQDFPTLQEQAADLGAKLILERLPPWLTGQLAARPQADAAATYTAKITKADGELKMDDPPDLNWRKIRAYTPWPGAYFYQAGKRVIIKKARLLNGKLIIDRVVPAGRAEMAYDEFRRSAGL